MLDLDYLKMSKPRKLVYNIRGFFKRLPGRIVGGLKGLLFAIAAFFKNLSRAVADVFITFRDGDWKTRLSYLVMGFGSAARGQWGRGILFFLFQTVFNLYIVNFGIAYLSKLNTLDVVETFKQNRKTAYGDNSFLILLYGVLTLFFFLAFIYTWYVNIKQNRISQQILRSGHKLKSTKEDLWSLADSQFHKTPLALPTLGVFVFTILPILFMILVAFTNFDYNHQPPAKLFTWVGFENFHTLLSSGSASYGDTSRQVLFWTLIWAFFATFLNYFLGMFVAIMINKKGIRIKKVWRTILVMTIAIPQFLSLLYVSKMFAADGLIYSYLMKWHWIAQPIPFWTDPNWARFTIILINIWIGISGDKDRAYVALAALHPLRPEEVLGLQWQDIDFENHTIHIRRAVTHPSRNLGMVGEPKTEASKRPISLVPQAEKYLHPTLPDHFVLGGEKPLSCIQVRRMCAIIQKEINFPEPIQPRRFRTTVLTDIYDVTKDIKSAQAAAGHTTAAMTLKYYVKGRESSQDTASPIVKAYGIDG